MDEGVVEVALVEEAEAEEEVGGASVDEEEGGAGVDSGVGEDSGAEEGSEEEEEGDGTRLIVRNNRDVFFHMLQHLHVNMYEIDMTKGMELQGARKGHVRLGKADVAYRYILSDFQNVCHKNLK